MSVVKSTAQSCPHDGAPANRVAVLPAGTRVADYTVVRLLGEGGMGAVYEVKHEVINRRAAMKFLLPEYTRKQEVVTRFLQEAKAVNVIGHDNIIDIYDYGEGLDGVVYFVMELLEGESLGQLLKRQRRLPIDRTVHIFGQLMHALAAAHQKKIVHRDLKPDNVFLTRRQSDPHFVKLLDFGVARMRSAGAAQGLTQQGSLYGTPQYMSPEQAMGRTVDARSDIFSLGVMMYRATVGKRLFTGDHLAAVLAAVIEQPVPPPRQSQFGGDIPEALEHMILRATQKDPAQRYQSVDEMLYELATVKEQAGIRDQDSTLSDPAGPLRVKERSADSIPRTKSPGAVARAAIAVAVVVVVGLVGVVFAVKSTGDSAPSVAIEPEQVQKTPAESRKTAFAELEKNLQSSDGALLRATAEALALAGTAPVAPLLYRALDSKGSPQIHLVAARALRDLQLPEAALHVRRAMDRAGQKVRVALAACLVELGDRDALATLERALHSDKAAQLTAAEALAMVGRGDRARAVLLDAMQPPAGRERWRRAARGLLALGDDGARQALRAELARPQADRAVAAAEILAHAGDRDGLQWLVRVVNDPDAERRRRAALALARIGNDAALDYVPQALASEDATERAHASAVAARLAEKGGNKHAEAIALLVHDPDRTVRLTAQAALLAF
ncbi:MAG: protein kinase [Proteobacteria bacterium]|nr:protein kinase [Pseudomonadota bacterium]